MKTVDGKPEADSPIYNPRLRRADQPDLTSAETMVESIIRPGMTDKEKAFAIYDFVRHYIYHWPATREGEKPDSFEYGVVYDPVKLVNVYGYGYCFQNRCVLEALWQLAGLEARAGGISGHSIAEVFYDGGYHYLDADQHGYCLLPDGKTVASIADVENDAMGLIVNQPNPPDPFFPATQDPKAPYESKYILAAYFHSRHNNHYQHDKIMLGHRMDIPLFCGMRLKRWFKGDGRFNIYNQALSMERDIGYVDPSQGPSDHISDKTYGTGELLYQPDLTTGTNEYAEGVWEEENIRRTGQGLEPEEASRVARCSFRIRTPYAIVGWPVSFTVPANPTGAAVLSLRFNEKAANKSCCVRVSTDNGRSWNRVECPIDPTSSVVCDISPYVVRRYEYIMEILFSGPGTRLEQVSARTAFQLSPCSLPSVTEGRNDMVFTLGQPTQTAEILPRLEHLEEIREEAVGFENIVVEDSSVRSSSGTTGELIYEVAPPKPGTIHGFSSDAGCRRSSEGRCSRDSIRVYYAENSPDGWKLIADDSDFPMDTDHWSYHLNATGTCSDNVRKLYIKYQITTMGNAGIRNIHIRLHWAPANAGRTISRGLRVAHEWIEDGSKKSYETVIDETEFSYSFDAGQNPENQCVVLEPVRADHLKWREDDPPMNRPVLKEEEVINRKNQKLMRRLLREIDADPRKAIPKAARCGLTWLESGAKEAAEMLDIPLD